MHNQPWESMVLELDINKAWDSFKLLLKSVIDRHVPLVEKKVRGRECPWLNSEIKAKMNERDYYLRKARKTGSEHNWSSYRRLRNTVTRLIRSTKATYTRSILRENINRPQDFWNQIKRCFPTKNSERSSCNVFKINGKNTSDKQLITNEFCSFFTRVGKILQESLPHLINSIWRNHDHQYLQSRLNQNAGCVFKFKEITSSEVKSILKKLKRNKASGCDEIPVSLIIDGATEIAGPLSHLINRSMEDSVFPSGEKCAKVTPIYKSGDKALMDNYRPISVLPVFSKVIERVVYNQIYSYLEDNNLLSKRQFGFRRKSSTQHAVTILSDYVRQNMDKGLMTGAVFLDLKKAFDTVDHSRLLSKLPLYGIKNEELLWFESYLFDRQQFVLYNGYKSDVQHISCGVPQGSILGPLLFNLLINDIDSVLKQCEIILYADDTVVYIAEKSCQQIEQHLNDDINLIADWLVENSLIVNLKKTKTECVLFGTHQRTSKSKSMEIQMNGQKITESQTYEYLGVIMDKGLTLAKHMERIFKKASSRTKLLSRIRHNINPFTAESIYNLMILPLMLYCSNIFVDIPESKKQLFEDIQIRALKVINGQRNSVNLPRVNCIRNRKCALEVFKCLHGLVPSVYQDYFIRSNHTKNTRGNHKSLILPKVRTESGRKSFAFLGAKIFNKLPNEVKIVNSIMTFKTNCKNVDFDF